MLPTRPLLHLHLERQRLEPLLAVQRLPLVEQPPLLAVQRLLAAQRLLLAVRPLLAVQQLLLAVRPPLAVQRPLLAVQLLLAVPPHHRAILLDLQLLLQAPLHERYGRASLKSPRSKSLLVETRYLFRKASRVFTWQSHRQRDRT
jgi:hypothetical protein